MSLGSNTPFSSISLTCGRTLSSANWRTVSRKRVSSSVSETRGAGAEAASLATVSDMRAILPDRGRKPSILASATPPTNSRSSGTTRAGSKGLDRLPRLHSHDVTVPLSTHQSWHPGELLGHSGETLPYIANRLDIPLSRSYSVATFYEPHVWGLSLGRDSFTELSARMLPRSTTRPPCPRRPESG